MKTGVQTHLPAAFKNTSSFMRVLKLSILLCLITLTAAVGQVEEIYLLTFSDPTNFAIMSSLSYKRPKTILILNRTRGWDYTIFWNGFVGGETQDQIDTETKTTRHESYDPAYLFRDSEMLKAISTAERKSLRKRTLKPVAAKKITLKGANYRTISSAKNIKGFYVSTTEPIFTSDRRYAFVKLSVFLTGYIEFDKRTFDDFGSVTIVYQKQTGGKWKKFKKYEHLIL
jgi:hypothetical protein